MKTKSIWSVLTLVVVCMLGVNFVSCSSDDDDNNGGSGNNAFVGTWQKYEDGSEVLKHVIWVFEANGKMYEHDVDENLNIIEGSTENFIYKTENNHLYTQKQKEGKEYDWKDEGAYKISGDIMELTKESSKEGTKVKRLKKIR